MKMKSEKKLLKISVSKLNELYLSKEIIYNGERGTLRPFRGEIIHIAYLGGLEPIPYAEVELKIWNNKTITKILPLSKVVLIASNKSKKSIAA